MKPLLFTSFFLCVIATPLVAHWPAVIKPGAINRKQYGHVKDLAPTFLEIAGVTPPTTHGGREILPMDGHSLLPALRDPAVARNTPLFWETSGHGALRDGRWKLVRTYNAERTGEAERLRREAYSSKKAGTDARTGKWELYDLESDPTESRDLAAAEPDRVQEMAARHEAWAQHVGIVPHEMVLARRAEFQRKNSPPAKKE